MYELNFIKKRRNQEKKKRRKKRNPENYNSANNTNPGNQPFQT